MISGHAQRNRKASPIAWGGSNRGRIMAGAYEHFLYTGNRETKGMGGSLENICSN